MIKDRRISERIPTRLKVLHGVSGPNFIGYTLDISANGMAIQSAIVFPTNRRICIDLYIGYEVTRLDGMVVWSNFNKKAFNSKMGIKLSKNIEKLIKTKFSIVLKTK